MWTNFQYVKSTGHGDTHLTDGPTAGRTDGQTDGHTNELLYAYGAPCTEA